MEKQEAAALPRVREAAAAGKKYSDRMAGRYTYAYFDHLHGEYQGLLAKTDAAEARKLEELVRPAVEKRAKGELSWDDVYTFDLAVLDYLPEEDLVRKAYDMRSKYRSVAGARDYDAYIASKPPDLTTLQLEATRKADDRASVATEVLRADIRYLLSQFYLYYSMMPLREGLREELTRRARALTLIFIAIFVSLLLLIQVWPWRDQTQGRFLGTILVVIFAGILGGFVSMLQRIQSAPNEGDALYNLAALSHGWKGISLSPLYGAIFAMLLYVLFTANILQGDVFPRIASQQEAGAAKEKGGEPAAEGKAAPPPAPERTSPGLPFAQTYPTDMKAYALLVIWCFIAGFAERLVPDTLNRLVAKNQSIQGART